MRQALGRCIPQKRAKVHIFSYFYLLFRTKHKLTFYNGRLRGTLPNWPKCRFEAAAAYPSARLIDKTRVPTPPCAYLQSILRPWLTENEQPADWNCYSNDLPS
jgi:hypothetical protein